MFPEPERLLLEVVEPMVEADAKCAPRMVITSHLNFQYWRARLTLPWPASSIVCGMHPDRKMAIHGAYLQMCDCLKVIKHYCFLFCFHRCIFARISVDVLCHGSASSSTIELVVCRCFYSPYEFSVRKKPKITDLHYQAISSASVLWSCTSATWKCVGSFNCELFLVCVCVCKITSQSVIHVLFQNLTPLGWLQKVKNGEQILLHI